MTDIVSLFETYCTNNSIFFSYGRSDYQNLVQSDSIAEKIYLFLDPVTRLKSFSEFGGNGLITFSGQFLLLIKGDLDKPYYETAQAGVSGKYEDNILPLLNTHLQAFEDYLNCTEYQVNQWQILDAINIYDANMDGLIVTYNLSVL